MELLEATIDREGWLRIDELGLRVRFAESPEGRLVPVGVETLEGVLTVRMLQQVPFGRIEAAANASAVTRVVSKRINRPARYRPVTVVFRESEPPRDYGPDVIDLSDIRALDRVEEAIARFGQYSNDFYQDFAEAYEREAVLSDRPAAVLAEEIGVSTTQIWRWVRVCRLRGYLAPSRAGRKS